MIFMISNIKCVDYRCYMFNTIKIDRINLQNISVLNIKGIL